MFDGYICHWLLRGWYGRLSSEETHVIDFFTEWQTRTCSAVTFAMIVVHLRLRILSLVCLNTVSEQLQRIGINVHHSFNVASSFRTILSSFDPSHRRSFSIQIVPLTVRQTRFHLELVPLKWLYKLENFIENLTNEVPIWAFELMMSSRSFKVRSARWKFVR
jgi:hypothetical protein